MSDERTLGQLLGEVTNIWRTVLDRRLKPLGLSQARWRVLLHVARAGHPLTQTELAARLGVGGPSLVSLLDRMESDGWISRRRHATDRRRNQIHLAPRAEKMMPTITAEAEQLRRDLTEGLDPAEIATAKRVLARIRARGDTLAGEARDNEMDDDRHA